MDFYSGKNWPHHFTFIFTSFLLVLFHYFALLLLSSVTIQHLEELDNDELGSMLEEVKHENDALHVSQAFTNSQ